MKTVIWIGLLALVLSCSSRPTSTTLTPSPTPSASECCAHESLPADAPQTEMSLYHLESTWTRTDGQPMQLKELRGQVVLVALVYSSCKNACPRILSDMQRIKTASGPLAKNLRFLLVSIDPEVDTPERLKAYSQEAQLESNWDFLQGSPDDVAELAALLGVKYKKVDATDYVHSNIITILDQNGEIVHQQEGLGLEPDQTVSILKGLVNGS